MRELIHSTSSVTLEITIPPPAFDTDRTSVSHIHSVSSQVKSDDPLAGIVLPLRISKQGSVTILSHEEDVVNVKNLEQPRALKSVHHGVGYASLHYFGRMRAANVSKMELGFLDRVDASHIRYSKKIVVKISDPQLQSSKPITDLSEPFHVSSAVFKNRLAAAPSSGKGMRVQSTSDVQQLPGIQSDDGKVYRMYVRTTGIYHLTYDDIRSFNIDPSSLDVKTLRIINKGQQIPVYVFDHQDGHFDPNDYIEFYGEEKRYDGPGTLGDFYYDPDTKDNVYYLVWGSSYSPIPSGGVKRMVEESGEIRSADNTKYFNLKDSSFATTLHYEENNADAHADLEVSDIDLRSDLRDHDFMAIVYAGHSFTTKTVIPFPDVRQNRPVSFRVALHGISHFDPGATDAKGNELPDVPDENDAWVSVNGQDVLHGIWDSQVLKFLSTDTVSQRTAVIPSAQLLGVNAADSSGGLPPITITFANRKQTTESFCRFAANWIEIGYDRMYYAYQDQLAFRTPRGSQSGLYQFTLQNFSRTDISIYRKGVSKISNVVLSSNPDQIRSAKAIFQLNISSEADEFLAVAESEKLKPYRYAVDDFAGLRAPTNSGEYLIITNTEHLPKGHNNNRVPLQDFLDYRTSSSKVTGKLIDVANIYDEFNFGARSPNAIKNFLTYAYNNWQDPPKYVMLVGVTHLGTGDPQPFLPPDQVPTPYIQAYLEGNVAGDSWYAMVDGDDLVPDLIMGRLATQTIDGDAAYLAKIKEYEADRVTPGDWKNRALFIGAGGSFDTDIDDLLEHDLPSRVDVLRQSTVAASPYAGNGQTLFNDVNAGLGCLAYFGHGGTAIWDDPLDSTGHPVLENTDLPRFHNAAHYPVILSMTCFTGWFDVPGTGILNGLLNVANAGAIACFGTTSFGWEQNDEHMAAAVLPNLFDSVGGSIAERILEGKIEYLLRANPGDLIPPTLMYAYHFLGDPLLGTLQPKEHVYLTPSSRTIQPGGTVQLNGTSTITTGIARIELADNKMSPLSPPHVIANVPVANGKFSITDNVPNTTVPQGTYRATVSDNSDSRYGGTAEDVTITNSRVTQLGFEPRPLPINSALDFSAAVQTPQSILSVVDSLRIYSQNAGGLVTERTLVQPMTLGAGNRYHSSVAGSQLLAGDRVVATVTLTTNAGAVTSDSATIIVGAASDPSVMKDKNHHALSGKFVSTKSGLCWSENVYNWGASPLGSASATLINERGGVALGTANVSSLISHGATTVAIPITPVTLDTGLLLLAVSPDAGTSPLNLRDSLISNDTTQPVGIPQGAIAYQSSVGTTLNGSTYADAHFDNDEAIFGLHAGVEGNIGADVIRLTRIYTPIQSSQPDIHFLTLRSHTGIAYSSLRVVSDSLGAIPISPSAVATLSLHIDSSIHVPNTLFIYRQDDHTKQWTQLATTRPQADRLTANVTNLGTFAIAYHTDTRPPVVDIAVEGQVFSNNGEVPSQPHIHAVIQDANGIDITPGKTIVKIDNRTLLVSEYTMLDSGRTTTTVNLRIEPTLTDGTHAITIQATDNNGIMNMPAKELDVHVSQNFSVGVLGSYPNPFTKDNMFIAYEIRGIAFASTVALDIYTVSGRRIRTMNFPSDDPSRSFGFLKGGTGVPTSLGYHEVWWDGRDDSGIEVANGVYFYRFTVNTPDASQEIKGKFARVR